MAFFSMHIFRSRLRTFSEAPALFTMYKSEGPISKTNKPPDRTAWQTTKKAGVDEILSFFVRDPSGDRFLPAVSMLPRESNLSAAVLA